MNRPLDFARANGWPILASHLAAALSRRLRDSLHARRLATPGFRTGRAPRLLGLSHIHLGPDFHAGDALWLEAVLHYAGQDFQPELRIGPHARLSDNVHIACLNRITIGAHLLCGSRVLISDHTHGCYSPDPATTPDDPAIPPAHRRLHSAAPILIGDNVWLGDGVAILAGAALGDGCILGANAVVTGPIPADTLAAGAPARPIRRWDPTTRAWIPLPRPNAPTS